MSKPKVIVICGPTASGKTALSIELAKRISGQIVSADSMQIYDEMDIGTAKPTKEEMCGIKHYLTGDISPNKRYSVSQYKKDAEKCIKEILDNRNNPIVVGGTGLYINSLIYGIDYPDMQTDLNYREVLERQVIEKGLDELYDRAYEIDSNAMQKISKNDKKRILRVLEIYHQTGKTKTELELDSKKNGVPYDYKIFCINMEREILYDRINKRVDLMIAKGLIEEVRNLYEKYGKDMLTSIQAIGYKEVIGYLQGIYSKEEMIEKIKIESRRYAKRQITWFKKIEDLIWLDGLDNIENNIKVILEEYNK